MSTSFLKVYCLEYGSSFPPRRERRETRHGRHRMRHLHPPHSPLRPTYKRVSLYDTIRVIPFHITPRQHHPLEALPVHNGR